ncbi:MAG: hypothetical protein H6636_03840 [Anaerolineales bacterium]|nr:hypothetical protein [Anaerolineales bacterium]
MIMRRVLHRQTTTITIVSVQITWTEESDGGPSTPQEAHPDDHEAPLLPGLEGSIPVPRVVLPHTDFRSLGDTPPNIIPSQTSEIC